MEINLEDNKMTDQQVFTLFNLLITNQILKKLNLSKNYLTNNSSIKIKDVLEKNENISELYLH